MEQLVTLAVILGISVWTYKFGKRHGSQAAFRVGWRRGRNSRRRNSWRFLAPKRTLSQ